MNISCPTWFNQQFTRDDGTVIANGRVVTLKAGTSDRTTTFRQDGTENTNPIVLDANGRCELYINVLFAYKFRVYEYDSFQPEGLGTLVYERDNVYGAQFETATTTGVTSVNGQTGDVTLDAGDVGAVSITGDDTKTGNLTLQNVTTPTNQVQLTTNSTTVEMKALVGGAGAFVTVDNSGGDDTSALTLQGGGAPANQVKLFASESGFSTPYVEVSNATHYAQLTPTDLKFDGVSLVSEVAGKVNTSGDDMTGSLRLQPASNVIISTYAVSADGNSGAGIESVNGSGVVNANSVFGTARLKSDSVVGPRLEVFDISSNILSIGVNALHLQAGVSSCSLALPFTNGTTKTLATIDQIVGSGVTSVNGQTGVVVLTASDVGALASGGTAVDSDKLDGHDSTYFAVAGGAPTAHSSSHGSLGSDPVTLAQSQVTNLTTDLGNKLDTSSTAQVKAGNLSLPKLILTLPAENSAEITNAVDGVVAVRTAGIANGLELASNSETEATVQSYNRTAGQYKQLNVLGQPVRLSYGGNAKLATTNTGADVTGTLNATTGLQVNGSAVVDVSSTTQTKVGGAVLVNRASTTTVGFGVSVTGDANSRTAIKAGTIDFSDGAGAADLTIGRTAAGLLGIVGDVRITGLTASQFVKTDASKNLVSVTAIAQSDVTNLASDLADKVSKSTATAQTITSDVTVTGALVITASATLKHSGTTRIETTSTGAKVTGVLQADTENAPLTEITSTPYSVTGNERFIEATTGSAVFNLPAATGQKNMIVIKCKVAGLNIVPNGTDTLLGVNQTITLQNQDSISLYSSYAGEWEIY